MNKELYLPENTRVSLELQGSLPLFRERYVSPQAGTVVLKGIFNQTAHLELLDGSRYRLLSPRQDREYPNQMAYPLVRLPEKAEVCRLRTPIKLEEGHVPRLRYTTMLDGENYVFTQITAGQRGFELWDGMEMQQLVRRERGRGLLPDLTVLTPVPALLVLLFPWLDNQTLMRQS
jgi:hypothetical protein